MSSKFLSGGSDLTSLQDGSFALDVSSAIIQGLTPDMPVRTSASKALTSGLIQTADCNFVPITNPSTAALDMNYYNIDNVTELRLSNDGDATTPPPGHINVYNASDTLKYQDSTATVHQVATTTDLAGYLPLSGGTMAGSIDMGNQTLTNVASIAMTSAIMNIGYLNTPNPVTGSLTVGSSNTGGGSGPSIITGDNNNASTSTNGQSIVYGSDNKDSNASGGSFIFGFGNTNGTGARNVLIGRNNTVPDGVNEGFVIGFNNTNSTSNSLLVGGTNQANIRAGGTVCDLGTVANPFKTIYLNANVAGPTNSRTADNIVSNAGASTGGNLASFSGTTGKIVTDSGVVATNVVTNTAGATTAGQVATYSDTTGKLITNSTTPILGTPASGTLTNCVGLPIASGVSGLGAGVSTMLNSFTSANIRAACGDENGTGYLVFDTTPDFTGPTARFQPLKLSTLTQYEAFTVSNSSVPQSYITANSIGTRFYAANTTNQGMVVKIRAYAQMNNWGGGGTLTIGFWLNGVANVNLAVPAGTAAGSHLMAEFDCTIRGTTLCRTQGILHTTGQFPVTNDAGGTWTKTNSNNVDVLFTWSVASPVNMISPLSLTIETHYQR